MYPSQIPTIEDISRKLIELHNYNQGLQIRSYFQPTMWGRKTIHQRFGERHQYRNPLPSAHITLPTKQEREEAITIATERSITYYNDHHIIDEYYHYITGWNELPEVTLENILIRVTHPILVYSAVTVTLVRKYAFIHGIKAAKELLKESCVNWSMKTQSPIKKWGRYFKAIDSLALPYPVQPFSQLITQQQTTQTRETFLLSYSTKATDYFSFKYGKKPAYKRAMGVELELDELTPPDIAVLKEQLGSHAIFKRDGSVSRGVEICTAPATLDIHKEIFKPFFEEKKTTLKANANCGLHVHVDKKGLSSVQIAKIVKFMYEPKLNQFIETIAGRAANTYCQTGTRTWEDVLQYPDNSDKYQRVNLVPTNTIEFRLFASTLDYKQFSRCLEFVQAVIDYTTSGEAPCSIPDMLKQANFENYLLSKRQFYPELFKFLNYPTKKETAINRPGYTIYTAPSAPDHMTDAVCYSSIAAPVF